MRALVTGAGGFCGKHLVSYLSSQRIEVHSLGSTPRNSTNHHVVADVLNIKDLTRVIQEIQPEFVFHLAGLAVSTNPVEYYRINSAFAVAILEALQRAGLEKSPVLLVGSAAEYGNVAEKNMPITEEVPSAPRSHYGISKLTQTLAGLARAAVGQRVVVVRPFNILGPQIPEHLVVGTFARQIADIMKAREPAVVHAGNLETIRDFVNVQDVVKIY